MPEEARGLWSEIEAELGNIDAVPDAHPGLEAETDWIRHAPYDIALDRVCADVAARDGIHRVLLQGRRCRTLDEALRSIGDALELPGYYGRNLDALDECLRELLNLEDGRLGAYFGDRVGRPTNGILLTIDNAEEFLADEPNRTDQLIGVLRRGAHPLPDPLGRRAPRTASFHVLLFTRQ